MSADDIVFLVRGRKVDPNTPPPAPRPPAPDPAPKRPTRPEGRSRHARYSVHGSRTMWNCREHALIDLGRSLDSLDGLVVVLSRADDYGYALVAYGYHLGLRDRLQGLHRDLVAATARDLARTLGQAVRIEVTEQGRATITHSIEVSP